MAQAASRGDLSGLLEGDRKKVLSAVDGMDADTLLSENIDVLVANFVARSRREPVALLWEQMTSSGVQEARGDFTDVFGTYSGVPMHRVTLTVPIQGNHDLLEYQPTTRELSSYGGDVGRDRVTFTLSGPVLTAADIEKQVSQWKERWGRFCARVNTDLANHMTRIEGEIRQAVEARRRRLLAARQLDAALNIPITRVPGTTIAPVPTQRRMPTLAQRRDPGRVAYTPEPALADADYQDIVTQCLHWARALERLPGVAAKFDEEELRDHLLISLNMYWQGGAAGELFNGAGKTDITIRERDNNVFIGELKVWGGAKAAGEAVDQLLTYLVWRDGKATLIMFIRNQSPDATITKLHAAIEAHPSHQLTKPAANPKERVDYILKADEEGRTVELAVLPVVLPPKGT